MAQALAQREEIQRLRVATLEELREAGVRVVTAGGRRVAVFADADAVHAVDNRCPHMGFPLDRGSVSDGILTCHWHQARFDLASGCTFDLFADDATSFDTFVEDGVVWVATRPRRPLDAEAHWRRLRRGLEQDVPLVVAKSLLGLLDAGVGVRELAREVVDYAVRQLSRPSEGLIRLACVAELSPHLERETAYQALLYAVRQIASETAASVPRRGRQPLEGSSADPSALKRWLTQWVRTRHRDAAERTLRTAAGAEDAATLADLVFGAATERLYANGGHLLDACNKTFELASFLGGDEEAALLSLLVPDLTGARGAEETTAWHHPVEIVEPLRAAAAGLPASIARNRGPAREDLLPILLGDDPLAIVAALAQDLASGAAPAELSARVALAAALRLARFATSNEVTDWFDPQHTLNFANAVDQAVRRSPTPDVVRGVFEAAISVYVDRYLDVPPARLPEERGRLDALPSDPDALRALLLEQLDQRGEIDAVADLVARYL